LGIPKFSFLQSYRQLALNLAQYMNLAQFTGVLTTGQYRAKVPEGRITHELYLYPPPSSQSSFLWGGGRLNASRLHALCIEERWLT
jgi:hypothetical protein